VQRWIEQHQHRACRVIRHDLNMGLPAARNTGAEEARTDRLLMLDADNELRRTAMPRLMGALDADPAAGFAYGIIERFSADGPEGLVSSFGWDPVRLRRGNYIDACAMVRRQALTELRGYSTDDRLYGWEDYDLWVRMAEAGWHAAFVPEIIARYRVGPSSMIWEANLSTTDAFATLVEHAPRLMAGLRIPS
jgi:GT2 family glycosyltransferase